MACTNVTHHYKLYNIFNYGINPNSRDVFLNSYIGDTQDDSGIDYRSVSTFYKSILYLLQISVEKDINIHLNSIGGEWSSGIAIYDIIQSIPCHTNVIGYGTVSSMATIIMQAGTNRIIFPNSEFMLHYGYFSIDSEHLTAESTMEWSNYTKKIMLDIYTKRCKKAKFFKKNKFSEEKVKSYINNMLQKHGDWYLNADDALKYGFVDYILGKSYKYRNLKSLIG